MSDKNDIIILNLDRPRELRFGHKALKTLGAMTDKDLNQLDEVLKEIKFEDIETIFYCGLLSDAKKNGETLKLEDMEDLLDYAEYNDLMKSMNDALDNAFSGKAGKVEKNEQGIAVTQKKEKK